MADITLCKSETCIKRYTCKRWLVQGNNSRQSYVYDPEDCVKSDYILYYEVKK